VCPARAEYKLHDPIGESPDYHRGDYHRGEFRLAEFRLAENAQR